MKLLVCSDQTARGKQQLKANGNGKSRVTTVLIPSQLQQAKGK